MFYPLPASCGRYRLYLPVVKYKFDPFRLIPLQPQGSLSILEGWGKTLLPKKKKMPPGILALRQFLLHIPHNDNLYFRVGVLAVLAISRMKYMVQKYRRKRRIGMPVLFPLPQASAATASSSHGMLYSNTSVFN